MGNRGPGVHASGGSTESDVPGDSMARPDGSRLRRLDGNCCRVRPGADAAVSGCMQLRPRSKAKEVALVEGWTASIAGGKATSSRVSSGFLEKNLDQILKEALPGCGLSLAELPSPERHLPSVPSGTPVPAKVRSLCGLSSEGSWRRWIREPGQDITKR